jgi:hypothetical protein
VARFTPRAIPRCEARKALQTSVNTVRGSSRRKSVSELEYRRGATRNPHIGASRGEDHGRLDQDSKASNVARGTDGSILSQVHNPSMYTSRRSYVFRVRNGEDVADSSETCSSCAVSGQLRHFAISQAKVRIQPLRPRAIVLFTARVLRILTIQQIHQVLRRVCAIMTSLCLSPAKAE